MSGESHEFQVHLRVGETGVGVLEWSGRAPQEAVDQAVSLAADDGLIARGLRRIEVSLPASDTTGRRALHRAGFRLEGTRRLAHVAADGTFADVVLYARLASDLVYGAGGFTGVMNSVLPRKRLIAHALITDPWDRVCLLETTFKPDWELPGGIVNTLESPWDGAAREIAEEMSLDVGVGRILVVDWLGPYLGWEDAVGAPVAAHVQPVKLDGTRLIVVTLNGKDDVNTHRQLYEHFFPLLARVDLSGFTDDLFVPVTGGVREQVQAVPAAEPRAALLEREYDALVREVSQDRPFLGICVGMQALLDSSEENGGVDCIGLFPGQVRFFGKDLHEDGEHLKVPHMGWNEVLHTRSHALWHGIADGARFYFVHSYYVDPVDQTTVSGTTDYGIPFTSAVARDNIFAIQCHPEKSAQAGLALLSNFIGWQP